MRRVMLLCSAGMSTSLLVQKMQNAAKLQEADVKIWACSEAEAKSHYDDVDVIMLGPQVRFLLSKVEAAVKNKNVRVAVVDIMNYGRMDGEAVLKQAMSL